MFSWNSLLFSTIQWMLAIWYLVSLPFLKLAWTSGSSLFMYCWSLAWTMFEHYFISMWDECNCAVVWAIRRDGQGEIPHVQGKRNPTRTVGAEGRHHRAGRLKLQSQKTNESNHMDHGFVRLSETAVPTYSQNIILLLKVHKLKLMQLQSVTYMLVSPQNCSVSIRIIWILQSSSGFFFFFFFV